MYYKKPLIRTVFSEIFWLIPDPNSRYCVNYRFLARKILAYFVNCIPQPEPCPAGMQRAPEYAGICGIFRLARVLLYPRNVVVHPVLEEGPAPGPDRAVRGKHALPHLEVGLGLPHHRNVKVGEDVS